MKLSQKKTCNGCKALEFHGCGRISCVLGFTFDDNFVPLEPCPKPRTNSELVEVMNERYVAK